MIIKKKDLKRDHWYSGEGRNANIAIWTGETFLTIGRRFDEYSIKDEGHWDDGKCFRPNKELDYHRVGKLKGEPTCKEETF